MLLLQRSSFSQTLFAVYGWQPAFYEEESLERKQQKKTREKKLYRM